MAGPSESLLNSAYAKSSIFGWEPLVDRARKLDAAFTEMRSRADAAEARADRLAAALFRFGPKVTTVSEWHSAECPVTHYPSIALMPCSDICKQARAALADVPMRPDDHDRT